MTSRILVVDMLQSDIPTHLISGIIVLHAEKYNVLLFLSSIVIDQVTELQRWLWKPS